MHFFFLTGEETARELDSSGTQQWCLVSFTPSKSRQVISMLITPDIELHFLTRQFRLAAFHRLWRCAVSHQFYISCLYHMTWGSTNAKQLWKKVKNSDLVKGKLKERCLDTPLSYNGEQIHNTTGLSICKIIELLRYIWVKVIISLVPPDLSDT